MSSFLWNLPPPPPEDFLAELAKEAEALRKFYDAETDSEWDVVASRFVG